MHLVSSDNLLKEMSMKKTIILSAAILAFSSFSANAGGFHLNFFTPAPVYSPPVYAVQPMPIYVAQQYVPVYRNVYPAYNYRSNYSYNNYDNHNYKHRNKHRNKHNRHNRHND
jgi:hypothetical protein